MIDATTVDDARRRSLLVSFAILQVNFDERGMRYIDNFVPFVAQCVKEMSNDELTSAEIQEKLQERFGLVIPQHALDTILKRGARKGLYSFRNHKLVRNDEALSKVNLEPTRQRALRAYRELLRKFVEFAKNSFGRELTEASVDEAFLNFIADRSIPIVRATLLGQNFQPEQSLSEQMEYLFAAFVADLASSDVEGFDCLDMIVRGCMLATALYLPDLNDRRRKVTDLAVYLDTPVIVSLIGLHDTVQQDAALELLTLLNAINVPVRCFTHTLYEVENLIVASAKQLSSLSSDGRRQNAIISWALNVGIGRSELEIKARQIEADLGKLNIQVRDVPDFAVHYSLDEAKLERTLQERVNYHREETRLYDVKSLIGIWRLRGGKSKRDLETARAIFVTSNSSVARASSEFFDERPNGFDVPICALDSHLATVAWLKNPTAAPNLPRKQIIADCFAALEPGEELWRQYIAVIDNLRERQDVSEEDYVTLRYTMEASRALVTETLGIDETLSELSVPAILRKVRRAQNLELISELESAKSYIAKVEADRVVAEVAAIAEANNREVENASSEAKLTRRIGDISHRLARRISLCCYVVMTVVLILATLGSLPFFNWINGVGGWIPRVMLLVWLLAGALSLLHSIGGISIVNLKEKLERAIEIRVERWLAKRLRGPS